MEQETNLENLSKEELMALRRNRIDFMKEQLKDLKIQSEYSNLKANIAENTLRERMAQMKYASLLAPPEKKPAENNEGDGSN